ncbi:hypothetical protein FRC03_006910, partial [Tulasnella sp. 419]
NSSKDEDHLTRIRRIGVAPQQGVGTEEQLDHSIGSDRLLDLTPTVEGVTYSQFDITFGHFAQWLVTDFRFHGSPISHRQEEYTTSRLSLPSDNIHISYQFNLALRKICY